MSVSQQVLQRSGEESEDDFDAGLANKWRWMVVFEEDGSN